MLFPRRDDITLDQMESYISEWAAAGLVIWYETDDDMWILFPSFEKNQVGLRKDKEPSSIIPELTDDCRIIAGQVTDVVRLKGREGKGKEENAPSPQNGDDDPPEPKQPTKSQLQNIARGELEDYFADRTKLAKPDASNRNSKRVKSAGELWWTPLRDILNAADWDMATAKKAVDGGVSYFENKGDVIIISPKTIVNTATGLIAKWKKNGGESPEDTTKYQPKPVPTEGSIWGEG